MDGLHATGGTGPAGATITDTFVFQLGVTANPNVINGTYYLRWFDPAVNAWVNAIAGNSNANLPADYSLTGAYFVGTYAGYLTTPVADGGGQGLALDDQLGAYGYDLTTEVAWAVLDYDSDVEVIRSRALMQ